MHIDLTAVTEPQAETIGEIVIDGVAEFDEVIAPVIDDEIVVGALTVTVVVDTKDTAICSRETIGTACNIHADTIT